MFKLLQLGSSGFSYMLYGNQQHIGESFLSRSLFIQVVQVKLQFVKYKLSNFMSILSFSFTTKYVIIFFDFILKAGVSIEIF